MKPTTNNLEEAIEKLAMAITHSEQGEYAKNEEYIREILTDLRKKDMEEFIKIIKIMEERINRRKFLPGRPGRSHYKTQFKQPYWTI